MDGVAEMFTIGRDELEDMRESPAWLADGIDKVLTGQSGPSQVSPSQSDSPKLMTEQLTAEDVKGIAEFGYYGGWRYTGMLPRPLAIRLGLEPNASAVLSMIGDQLIQATQNPERNGELPYGSITLLPNSDVPYGLSPLTVIKYLQEAHDAQLMLTIQAMIEAVFQNYLIGGGAGGTSPNFRRMLENRKPRECFVVTGDVSQIAPLPKDYQGLTVAAQGLSMLSQSMRDASNARDPVQGGAGPDRQTATAASMIQTSALQNVDQLAVLIERDELPRQGRLCYGAYYINLDDEGKYIRRVGDDQPTSITFMDIDGDYSINFVGARLTASKPVKANQFRDFLQLMLSNPLTAASLDVVKLVKRYADEALDVKGLEELIIEDPNEVVARLQAAGISGPIQGNGSGPIGGEAVNSAQAAGEASA